MASVTRYDFVVLGATGYTGKLCAEYITTALPTDITWAIAGRSRGKLEELAKDLKKLNPDRRQPSTESVQFTPEDLRELVTKCTIVINCVGPYHKYSSPVVEACAATGTHYLDVTGETPWVREMIEKYHKTAVQNKAVIIPQIGLESAPSDLVAYMVVTKIREIYSTPTYSMICAARLKSSGPSGGTLDTVLSIWDKYPLKYLTESRTPYILSPKPPSFTPPSPRSFLARLFGPFKVSQLGLLTTAITARPNQAIVHRSAGLMHDLYGPRFSYSEYMRVSGRLSGIAIHWALLLFAASLVFRPVRWLMRKFVYSPGSGPTRESTEGNELEYRAVGNADGKSGQVLGRFKYRGGIYYMTGALLAEAAMVMLKEKELLKKLDGGLLTPARLGEPFIQRLRSAGFEIEATTL
ncbi:MAG: hypothetical protein Q9227_003191 [Pyrenula ochraceoflavens]